MFTFGVELECYPRDLDHCVPTLVSGTYKERTLKSLYERCSHSERRPEFLAPSGHKWLISKDGSLRDGGAEFVSSPYREDQIPVFISDLQWFRDVIQITTDQSCGGHIHISWDELPLMRQGDRFGLFYNLLENMSKIEDAIFSYSGGKVRRNATYCKKIQKYTLDNLSMYNLANADRYQSLNCSSYFKHGTVEFRIFAGSSDPAMWGYNLNLAISIVRKTLEGAEFPTLAYGNLKGLAEFFCVPVAEAYDKPLWYVIGSFGHYSVVKGVDYHNANEGRTFKNQGAARRFMRILSTRKIEQSSRLRACLQKMDRYIDLLRNPSWTEQEAYDRIYG